MVSRVIVVANANINGNCDNGAAAKGLDKLFGHFRVAAARHQLRWGATFFKTSHKNVDWKWGLEYESLNKGSQEFTNELGPTQIILSNAESAIGSNLLIQFKIFQYFS